jgi:AcrR family transcriptional regulator
MPRDTLTREQVVTAAIELMDAEGLDGLNMRALGRRLDSAATAVYWHVGSKANLITLAGDQAWGEVTLPDPAAVGWRAAAAAMATGLHAMLTRHPWVVQALGSYPLFGPGKARHDDHLIAIYEAAGFSAGKADQATAAVVTYVLGNALGPAAATSLTRKLSRHGGDAGKRMGDTIASAREIATKFPRLRARLETPTAGYYAAPEHSFEFGLQAILDGLEAQLIVRRAAAGRNARKASPSRPGTIPRPGAGLTAEKPPHQSERAR